MSTDELLLILAERGLRLVLKGDGSPSLRGPAAEVTPVLRRALAFHRQAILGRLGAAEGEATSRAGSGEGQGPREWLWRTGHTHAEEEADYGFGERGFHAGGAWWWRHRGEADWRPVPGRGGEAEAPPPLLAREVGRAA